MDGVEWVDEGVPTVGLLRHYVYGRYRGGPGHTQSDDQVSYISIKSSRTYETRDSIRVFVSYSSVYGSIGTVMNHNRSKEYGRSDYLHFTIE